MTGIDVQWELLPLHQVLARLGQDTAGRLGASDIYYWDQVWIAEGAQLTPGRPTEHVGET